MNRIKWYKGITLMQDKDAVKDYLLDFSNWLGLESIATISFVLDGCACALLSQNTTAAKVRVSGVTSLARVTITLATDSGQRDDFTVYFKSIDK